MKVILEFNLPEELEEHQLALNGSKYRAVIELVLDLIRKKIKYEERSASETELLEEIRDFINEEMEGYENR